MDLKMTSRQLERQSMKLETGEKAEMKKIMEVSAPLKAYPFWVLSYASLALTPGFLYPRH